MYAIIEACGKQYKAEPDGELYLELLGKEVNDTVEFPVLALGGEDGLKIGTPYVEGATVKAQVVKNGKGKKITVFTYKVKKGYKKTKGHRQPYSKVKILSINA